MSRDQALPAVQELALAHAPPSTRAVWHALFLLDLKLAQVVRNAREPLPAQIRLAWWRDALAAGPERRPSGEPVLDLVSRHLDGLEDSLAALAAAWEWMLAEPPMPHRSLEEYVAGRARVFAALAPHLQRPDEEPAAAEAARWWVLGDTLSNLSDPAEREVFRALDAGMDRAGGRLSRPLRPLAVLGALGRRAFKREEPLLEGRGSALLALRAGIIGR